MVGILESSLRRWNCLHIWPLLESEGVSLTQSLDPLLFSHSSHSKKVDVVLYVTWYQSLDPFLFSHSSYSKWVDVVLYVRNVVS